MTEGLSRLVYLAKGKHSESYFISYSECDCGFTSSAGPRPRNIISMAMDLGKVGLETS